MPTTPSLSNQQGRVGMSSTIAPDPTVWSRRRLLGILAVAVVTAMCLLGGLVYAVVLAVGEWTLEPARAAALVAVLVAV